jgi:hypothetical protein
MESESVRQWEAFSFPTYFSAEFGIIGDIQASSSQQERRVLCEFRDRS